ncbi:ACT domain-containing protein [Isoptericola sp. 4D.3]|uniref:ACT domain-containing protein n=1 Tax=Isoptericola peretonis TaxID=2918523 RepID=A0ABT0J236_9MICO|nr:ACT domain-containing protein [Isoptericola sp. 4D.3]
MTPTPSTTRPQDLEVVLAAGAGALAGLGESLGHAGVSLEGGGVTTHDGTRVAHFLVDDGPRALAALAAAGIGPAVARDVVMTRLDQDVPGQMGAFARRLADADVAVQVLYSDHAGSLVLLVPDEDLPACRAVVREWDRERDARRAP